MGQQTGSREKSNASQVRHSALPTPHSALPVALLTDFGTCDWFAGSLKAAIAKIAPSVPVIDITHEIPPGDVRTGAFVLRACCRDFPAGTVFAAVVDPGVGGARAAIAASAGEYLFVGPDNGVLSWAADLCGIHALHRIENPRFFRKQPSATFHGRDIFAPVAAHLALGVGIGEIGPRAKEMVRIDWPTPGAADGNLTGAVVHIDRFGNAVTSIEAEHLSGIDATRARITAGSRAGIPLCAFYQEVPPGEPLAVIGSAGMLEISVNGSSAAVALGLRIGSAVTVSR